MTEREKWIRYEQEKRRAQEECKTSAEYEARLRELAKRY